MCASREGKGIVHGHCSLPLYSYTVFAMPQEHRILVDLGCLGAQQNSKVKYKVNMFHQKLSEQGPSFSFDLELASNAERKQQHSKKDEWPSSSIISLVNSVFSLY